MPRKKNELASRNSKLTPTALACLNSLKRFLKTDTQSEAIIIAHIRITGSTEPTDDQNSN